MGVPSVMAALAVLLLFSGAVSGQNLLTLVSDDKRNNLVPCRQPDVQSCTQALVDMTLLKTSDTIIIPGHDNTEITLSLSSRSDNSAVFKNGIGKTAYFTWRGPSMFGHVQAESESWTL